MKAFFIPTALLTMILAASILIGSYVERTCGVLINKIDQCTILLDQEQWDQLPKDLQDAYTQWQQHSDVLHMILDHQSLEDGEQIFLSAFSACREHDTAELRTQLCLLVAQLRHLSETQSALLRNIL